MAEVAISYKKQMPLVHETTEISATIRLIEVEEMVAMAGLEPATSAL
jgi:hypothetical protein